MRASNVLEDVGHYLDLIRRNQAKIIEEPSRRSHAFHYPVEILDQKYHYCKGYWYLKLGSEQTKQMALKEFF